MTKKLERLAEIKAPYDEFTCLITFIEKENLVIDKLDYYKQSLKDFVNWEQEISKFLVNKETLEVNLKKK